jgi:hypothetical protein
LPRLYTLLGGLSDNIIGQQVQGANLVVGAPETPRVAVRAVLVNGQVGEFGMHDQNEDSWAITRTIVEATSLAYIFSIEQAILHWTSDLRSAYVRSVWGSWGDEQHPARCSPGVPHPLTGKLPERLQ